jgi:hypothetical protein
MDVVKGTDGSYNVLYDSAADLEREGAVVYGAREGGTAAVAKVLHAERHIRCSSYERKYYEPQNWVGCDSYAEALGYLQNGWPAMLKKMREMMGTMAIDTVTLAASHTMLRRRKRKHSDTGDMLSMPRVWSGELDRAWERPVRVPQLVATQRHATLYIDLGCSYTVTAEQALWRGAAAMYICDLLQRSGRSVEIYVGSTQQGALVNGPHRLATGMRVKTYMQPLHEEMLAAQVTPAFFRMYGFAMIHSTPWTAESGLGHSCNMGLPAQLEARAAAGELVVGLRGCLSKERAEAEVMKVIGALSNVKEAA